MANRANHEIALTLHVIDIAKQKPVVFAVVSKPSSEEGATSIYPYAVWVADSMEELRDPAKRMTRSSSVETLSAAIRMYFDRNAEYALATGLTIQLGELLKLETDEEIVAYIHQNHI